MAAPKKYPDELRARAVRLYWESDPKPVIRRLAERLGVHPEALRNWVLCRPRHKIHYAEVRVYADVSGGVGSAVGVAAVQVGVIPGSDRCLLLEFVEGGERGCSLSTASGRSVGDLCGRVRQ